MYEIELTPKLCLDIRAYNDGIANGYGDFDLECELGTGEKCESNFIRSYFSQIFKNTCGVENDWDACS